MNIQRDKIKIIASTKSWIEGEAVRQLESSMNLPGMEFVVGLPDLHPGKGNPVGAAFAAKGRLYPFLVGNDIGCGIGMWRTSLLKNKLKKDRWVKRLSSLHDPWDGDYDLWFEQSALGPKSWESSMGTIGGGNHFAELQMVESIEDHEAFKQLCLERDGLVLVIHSGSRGLGESILRRHVEHFGAKGTEETSEEASIYLADHNYAMRWAAANRELIAQRFLSALSAEGSKILDLCHNSVLPVHFDGSPYWLHRKGAAPSDQGPVMIPGSRGAFSYLVVPIGDHSGNAYSIAHGAGRKWGRNAIKDRLKGKVDLASLRQTKLGSLVVCDDKDLLFEEAPDAYKSIETVIDDLKNAGLIRVIAVFRPVITFK